MKAKIHKEFHQVDAVGWETPEGYPPAVTQKILADNLDPATKTGTRSLLMRFAPGAATSEAFAHDECEEVFIYEGDLVVGTGAEAQQFHAPTFACRPGNVLHGPFSSENGCLMFAHFHY